MNIELPSDAAEFIDGLVAAGEYRSASEAVTDGVRLLIGRQQLRADIQKGVDQLDAGQGLDADVVFTKLRERAKALTEIPE